MTSTRALAAELGVSRNTITSVYEQLAAEGFLVTKAGRAARVAMSDTISAAPERARERSSSPVPSLSSFGQRMVANGALTPQDGDRTRYDFLYGAVASLDFPVRAWRRAYQTALLQKRSSLSYLAPEGDLTLRQSLSGYLRRARGISCDADQILVVHGSQQALDLCARLLLDESTAFAFENPGYLMARYCFEATGALPLPIPVDELGLDTGRLPENGRTRLAYVTPSHQFPLGGVLPIGRRMSLLQWARRQNAWIIEDDYDGEFRYGQRPIDALQSIDRDGRVIYIGTFSKTLSPQLRLGYMVLPPTLIDVFRRAKRMTDRHVPILEQQVLASFIDSGAYERHVRRVRRENERRRTALLQAIAHYLPEDVQIAGTAAGLHMVLWFPRIPAQDTSTLIAAARDNGVGIYPVGALFAASEAQSSPSSAGLIIGYASLTPEQIRAGISRLAESVAGMACPDARGALNATSKADQF